MLVVAAEWMLGRWDFVPATFDQTKTHLYAFCQIVTIVAHRTSIPVLPLGVARGSRRFARDLQSIVNTHARRVYEEGSEDSFEVSLR